ncbi:uncharacterized protein PRCAT00003433001 [Priceomyces carsonii]|uniref:uncharacterized protein n=1 Tax=Priceomyces carsonii TaxID=28549 RepID=UPI002EDA737C|nr:unnamed protein product [Priceomyces carsonii]
MSGIPQVRADNFGNTVNIDAPEALQEGAVNIEYLPIEILINIFSNLDPGQLTECRLVCKRWNFAVLDKSTWFRIFASRFGTGASFPSLSGSKFWTIEYFRRIKTYKKWNKATALHRSYQLINNEFFHVDTCLVNFPQGKLLTSSRLLGNVSICNLENGKNQAFIPGNHIFTEISSYSITWNYMLVGKRTGELYLKNLFTSTSSVSGKVSLVKMISESSTNDAILATALNPNAGKPKEIFDCISGSYLGFVKVWSSKGTLVKEFNFGESIYNIVTDFRHFIIAQTKTSLVFVQLGDSLVRKVRLDFEIDNFERCFMDFDSGGKNVIISYDKHIRAVNFESLDEVRIKGIDLEESIITLRAKMQIVDLRRPLKQDASIVGGDGLLYANVLSDDSVIIWNVRDTRTKIIPACTIRPTFSKHAPEIPADIPLITTVALNSSVIVIGGYNGFTNLHNVFTGDYIKECSAKLPRKLTYGYHDLVPISNIELNEDQAATNGVIVCGDKIQYFQFDDSDNTSTKVASKKRVNFGSSNKNENYKQIRDGIEDYDKFQEQEEQSFRLFDKYNGKLDDDDDELSIALAVSQSYRQKNLDSTDDIELAIAMELSKQSELESSKFRRRSSEASRGQDETLDEDDEIRKALELSLLDQ